MTSSGVVFKPFIILPNLKRFKRLTEFLPDVHDATTLTGWMNRNVFNCWAICFGCELSVDRLTLPGEIRDEPVLLILDGQISRLNVTALTILDAWNRDVLCVTGHSTDVIQAFDVAIASPLK
jgi:hypothetical protein